MNALYHKLLDIPRAAHVLAGIPALLAIICAAMSMERAFKPELLDLLMSGHLIFGLFLTLLVTLVTIGLRIDNLPGKCITLAISALAVGGILWLLLPFFRSIGWLGEWNGVMLGIMAVTVYLTYRIKARFAMTAIVSAMYAGVVTAGLSIGIVPEVNVSTLLAALSVGALAIVLAFLGYSHVKMILDASRREPIHRAVRVGMARSINFIVATGFLTLIFAIPLVVVSNVFWDLGVLFLIGGPVSAIAVLTSAAPLEAMTRGAPRDAPAVARQRGRKG